MVPSTARLPRAQRPAASPARRSCCSHQAGTQQPFPTSRVGAGPCLGGAVPAVRSSVDIRDLYTVRTFVCKLISGLHSLQDLEEGGEPAGHQTVRAQFLPVPGRVGGHRLAQFVERRDRPAEERVTAMPLRCEATSSSARQDRWPSSSTVRSRVTAPSARARLDGRSRRLAAVATPSAASLAAVAGATPRTSSIGKARSTSPNGRRAVHCSNSNCNARSVSR